MNTQQTFTQLLRDEVEQRGLAFGVDLDFSNAGVFRARIHGTLIEICRVQFSFQTRYASLEIQSERGIECLPYVVAEELSAALAAISKHLPAKPTPKMRRRSRR